MTTFVWAYNPATGGVARHSEAAHAEVWSRLGFELVDVDLAAAAEELGEPVGDASQLPEGYVRSVAARRATPTTTLAIEDESPETATEPAPTPTTRRTSKES